MPDLAMLAEPRGKRAKRENILANQANL